MFLLTPSIFGWDLILLVMMSSGLSLFIITQIWIRSHPQKKIAKKLVGILGILGILGFLITSYSSLIEPQIITTVEHGISLPVTQPLKIAVISDQHVGPYKGKKFTKRVVERVNQTLPDIVLLTGDFIFTQDADVTGLSPLKNLQPTYGTFAVLGNHDFGRFRVLWGELGHHADRSTDISAVLEKYNVTVLHNENRVIQLGDERIVIAGIDDLWSEKSSIEKALEDVPDGITTLLLSHNPSIIDDERSKRADLIVSGHTHGGQVRIPRVGPMSDLPTTLGKEYDEGVFPLENNTLVISRGVGETGPRVRLFAWPQIMILNAGSSS